MKLTFGSHFSASGFTALGDNQWLHKLGGRRQRGQRVDVVALRYWTADKLASAAGLVLEAAEPRFRWLVLVGWPRSRRALLPSSRGSCAPLPEAFGTLGHAILTFSVR